MIRIIEVRITEDSLYSLCPHLRSHLIKPAQDIFEKKQLKKNSSDNKMAVPEATNNKVRSHLCYHFALYQTNESCSESVSRLMLLRSLNISCLRVTAPNVTKAERPFYECSHMVLHEARKLLLQLLASVLSSHVRFWILHQFV